VQVSPAATFGRRWLRVNRAPACKTAERTVHTAVGYRKLAEECFEWAAKASSDENRATYLSSAKIWLQAASRLDGGLPIRGAVIPKQGNGKLNEPEPS
jgi:hypothetical protein